MKRKIVVFVFFCFLIARWTVHGQFSTWSGTIRFSGGLMGGAMAYTPMFTAWLLYEGFSDKGVSVSTDTFFDHKTGQLQIRNQVKPGTFSAWIRDNHRSFLRFFNGCYDFIMPQWSLSFSNSNIKVDRNYATDDENTFNSLFFPTDSYVNHVGYYLNWKDLYSRYGFYVGADYELRKYSLEYKSDIGSQYHLWHANNEIQQLVPSVGLRYRIIDPYKEIDGFPFNVVLEAGASYAIAIGYKEDIQSTDSWSGYTVDVINNGFRVSLGIVITTNKWGALYVRWTKELYNLYNNDNVAANYIGYLFGNEIKSNFSFFSMGYATFL